ncbi:Sec-independent protein translocase protein TatB [Thioclava atlantica]|uniref:Sec-independent protein translocase protein TatB n=1 Tax=Thioclava atlantica TaxID=1317124 RepID=A0A085U1Z5_9RHOB|nr:Sec-independent protein translocase protein TatB [Thioclava atlantica]KFE36992.1 twin-arginine translocation protein subunit TatB [Thioclava atlantica]
MFDIGWSELLLVGVVALIVVGPKDLPKMFHQLGRITAKAKSMAREFSRAMEDAAKDTGLDEAAGSMRDLKSLASKKSLGIDALEKAADSFEKWEPKIPDSSKAAALKPDPEAEPPKPEAAPAKPAGKKPAAKKAAAPKKTAAAKPAAKTAPKSSSKTAAKPAAKKTAAARKPAPKKDDA